MLKPEREKWIGQFINGKLNPLLGSDGRERDAAALAKLRRCAGKQPTVALEQVGRLFDGVPDKRSRVACFENTLDPAALVASLFALWHQGGNRGTPSQFSGSFGDSFRQLREQQPESESVPRRFAALLDSHPDDLPQRLRHAISLLRSKDVPVNWTRLLSDLLNWNAERRSVQRRWARDFWVGRSASETATSEKDAETTITRSTSNLVSE